MAEMAGEKILIVDDEPDIFNLLKVYFEKENFRVIIAADGLQAITLARTRQPDLIILDILLPEIDGFDVCRVLRAETSAPIIFLSCKSDETDKIVGLGLGADDYVTKPFSSREMVARVKAHLRRDRFLRQQIKADSQVLSFENLTINPRSREVNIGNRPVNLSNKEFDILYLLATHPNQVFSVDQIYEKIWGYDHLSDIRTVMVHIRTLRLKIEANPSEPQLIITVRGSGYKFNPP